VRGKKEEPQEKRIDPRFSAERERIENERQATEESIVDHFSDRRAGLFFMVDGKRVHESDLTSSQRSEFGLNKKESADAES
jgi:hypothetical protein